MLNFGLIASGGEAAMFFEAGDADGLARLLPESA